jgi:hypothetical protein
MSAWTDDPPLKLHVLKADDGNPDPIAICCYGMLRNDTKSVMLRLAKDRPRGVMTIQFWDWLCEELEDDRKKRSIVGSEYPLGRENNNPIFAPEFPLQYNIVLSAQIASTVLPGRRCNYLPQTPGRWTRRRPPRCRVKGAPRAAQHFLDTTIFFAADH